MPDYLVTTFREPNGPLEMNFKEIKDGESINIQEIINSYRWCDYFISAHIASNMSVRVLENNNDNKTS